MSPDTPQPQPGLTLREQVALALARCADNTWAQADAVIPLVAKAQREADVARAKTHHWSYAVVDDLITAPLISEEGATRGD